MTKILGIVNITADSFSDGGEFLRPEAAIRHAEALLQAGADAIDLGPASTHPDAEPVSVAEEIRRLEPVIDALAAPISIDSYWPETQRWALEKGVAYINDIQGFPDPTIYPELAAGEAGLFAMFSVQASGGATREDSDPEQIVSQITAFFDRRLEVLTDAGIARERLILDPGMGFFLGSDPACSLAVIRAIPALKARYDLPILVSVSRKSFLRKITGTMLESIGPATLSAELAAARAGADWIRTHDVAALRDALVIQEALDQD